MPHHPQLTRKSSPELTRAALRPQLQILGRYLRPDTALLEVGPGDCALSMAVAPGIRQVYGLDVSQKITEQLSLPSNFKLILSDGSSVPLPPESVDVAYSNQLMEHLHPDDAREQLQGICRALRPGGVYICITPNRLNGPHDVSKFFDIVARGFHLKEYTIAELEALFRQVGFQRVQAFPRFGGRYVRLPLGLVKAFEGLFGLLPVGWRRRLGRRPLFRNVLSAPLRAIK